MSYRSLQIGRVSGNAHKSCYLRRLYRLQWLCVVF